MAPPVQILMCTYDGAAHLAEQLASFEDQDHREWALWVGEDGSTDATPDILAEFARRHRQRDIRVVSGPRAGSARNFLNLLYRADLGAGYVAFSDQDDVWFPDKLSRALSALATGDPACPAVYASRTMLTGPNLEKPRPSRLFRHPPTFGNALVQNILPGNTLVLNPAAVALMRAAGAAEAAADVPFHDWWVYQLLAGAGARIVTDPQPSLYYRQHGRNLMGSNRGLAGGLERLRMAGDTRFSGWIDRNTAALDGARGVLTPTAIDRLDGLARLRRMKGRAAVAELDRLGIRRQTKTSDIVVRALARAGRL